MSCAANTLGYFLDSVSFSPLHTASFLHDREAWKMQQSARPGWLHEAVRTSCLHTKQHWCLLSDLILVNTDVHMKKRSDRCMIEVLKSRRSQHLSSDLPGSLWLSSCVSDIICIGSPHKCHSIDVMRLLRASELIVRWSQQFVMIASLSFTVAEFPSSSFNEEYHFRGIQDKLVWFCQAASQGL